MRHFLFFAAATIASLAGCLRKTEFKCQTSDQCSTGGVCETTTGYCSFVDMDCPDGRRYGGLSGDLSGQCVGGGGSGVVDAGVDGSMIMIDAPPGCPATGYATIAGAGTHHYRVVSTTANWATQKGACSADGPGAYLAVPNDQAELTAILAAAGPARSWVGINDITTEGTYVTSQGASFSATDPLWDANEPNNTPFNGGGESDCVAGVKSSNQLADTKCSEAYAAICECDP